MGRHSGRGHLCAHNVLCGPGNARGKQRAFPTRRPGVYGVQRLDTENNAPMTPVVCVRGQSSWREGRSKSGVSSSADSPVIRRTSLSILPNSLEPALKWLTVVESELPSFL